MDGMSMFVNICASTASVCCGKGILYVKESQCSPVVGHIPPFEWRHVWPMASSEQTEGRSVMQDGAGVGGKCGLLGPVLNVLSLLISAVFVFGNNASGSNNLLAQPSVSHFKINCLHACKRRTPCPLKSHCNRLYAHLPPLITLECWSSCLWCTLRSTARHLKRETSFLSSENLSLHKFGFGYYAIFFCILVNGLSSRLDK